MLFGTMLWQDQDDAVLNDLTTAIIKFLVSRSPSAICFLTLSLVIMLAVYSYLVGSIPSA